MSQPNLNIFLENGRRPQFFWKWKTTSILFKLKITSIIFLNGRWPQICYCGTAPDNLVSSFLSVCRIIFPPMFQFNKLLFQSVHRTCQTLPFLLHLTWRTMTLLSLRLQMFACNYAGNTSSACSGALELLGMDLSNQICFMRT